MTQVNHALEQRSTTNGRGQRVGYVRVSTIDQSTERQLDGLQLDRIFTDKASGKDAKRPQLQAALAYVREGDTLVVHSMDRLARNMLDLLQTVKNLNGCGVAVHFVKESLTFTGQDSPLVQLQLGILGAVAEFERALIRERQREGIAIAKAKGVYKGRKRALSDRQVVALRERDAANGGRGRAALAREFKISRSALYEYLKAETHPATKF